MTGDVQLTIIPPWLFYLTSMMGGALIVAAAMWLTPVPSSETYNLSTAVVFGMEAQPKASKRP